MNNLFKLSINDFKAGDLVHHFNNGKLILRVEEIFREGNEIRCSCIDLSGIRYESWFMPEELIHVNEIESDFDPDHSYRRNQIKGNYK